MLFVPFDNPTRRNQLPPQKNGLTFGFCSLFVVSLIFMVLCLFVIDGLFLANIPSRTFAQRELWRLNTAPLATLDGFLGFFSVFLSFWWLIGVIPIYERKYSTVHLYFQIGNQNLLIQICYSIVATILVKGGAILQTYNSYLFNMGWFPILIVWMFKFAQSQPQKLVNFCFLPFNIRKKFLPWICSIFLIILTNQRSALVVAVFLGFIQSILLKSSIIKTPICLQKFAERIIPPCFKNMNSFITIEQAEEDLNDLWRTKHPLNLKKESSEQQLSEQDHKVQLKQLKKEPQMSNKQQNFIQPEVLTEKSDNQIEKNDLLQ